MLLIVIVVVFILVVFVAAFGIDSDNRGLLGVDFIQAMQSTHREMIRSQNGVHDLYIQTWNKLSVALFIYKKTLLISHDFAGTVFFFKLRQNVRRSHNQRNGIIIHNVVMYRTLSQLVSEIQEITYFCRKLPISVSAIVEKNNHLL